VNTLLQPADPELRLYEAKLGITQQWASQLVALGVPAALALAYDRTSGAATLTLGQLAAAAPGTAQETFHFVLDNTVVKDSRIPPFGLRYDDARQRSALPVPPTRYGNPGTGGTYEHVDTVALQPPAGAAHARIELLYQAASWEYVQFLRLANSGQVPFLATTGVDLFDGWRATGMAPPEAMADAGWCRLPGTGDDLELRSGLAGGVLDGTCAKRAAGGQTVRFALRSPGGMFAGAFAAFAFEVYHENGPLPAQLLPGVQLDRADNLIAVVGLPTTGATFDLTIPPGLAGTVVRTQGIVISPATLGGFLGTSAAHDLTLR
jgi:hypothetical protein